MRALAIGTGALLGAVLMREPGGVVAGAAIGYLLIEVLGLRGRVARLEADAAAGAASALAPDPAPAPAPARGAPDQPGPAPSLPVVHATPVPDTAAPVAAPLPLPQTPPQPPEPARPAGTGAAALADWLPAWLTGGNTVVRVGVVVLFFGVAFLLKYAAEHTRVPVGLRLAGVALGALALLVTGAWLRRRRAGYGLTLEGGAIGILYLVVFAALRVYALVPALPAFALLVGVCALSVALAVAQDSLALAVLGVAGGFVAPILTSTGDGDHVMLFAYYAVLNAGILTVAWFRSWRLLNLTGFAFTFVIGGLWGYRAYQPALFATTEPFLVLFFLMYVAIAVLFAVRRAPDLRNAVDAGLLFGVPVVGFALQAQLVQGYEYGLAWSAFALGAFYGLLAAGVARRAALRPLAEVFIALGVIFATLAVPLALDDRWTAAAWAIEGAGVVWVGLRQDRPLARGFGLLVQLGAACFFIRGWPDAGQHALVNAAFIGTLLIAAAGFVSALLMHRYRSRLRPAERGLATVVLAWSVLWWYFGAFNEIGLYLRPERRGLAGLLVVTASLVFAEALGTRERWTPLRGAAALKVLLLPPALAGWVLAWQHPFAQLGFLAWPAALAAHYAVLRRHEHAALTAGMAGRHVLGFWVVLAIAAVEVYWVADRWLPAGDWAAAAVGGLLAGAILAVDPLCRRVWPFKGNAKSYLGPAIAPAVLAAVVWIGQVGIARAGDPAPWPYWPLVNPIDMAAMLILVALRGWAVAARPLLRLHPQAANFLVGALAFAWANAVLFRALHHLAGLPYTLEGMLSSVLAQSAVSIFWTSLALVLMPLALRARNRAAWAAGAVLLGAVVVKLFVVDLSNTGTVGRIVSFVVVGLLLLVIGYVAPVPPRSPVPREASP